MNVKDEAPNKRKKAENNKETDYKDTHTTIPFLYSIT